MFQLVILKVENFGLLVEFVPVVLELLGYLLVFVLEDDDGLVEFVDSEQFVLQFLGELYH